MKMVERLCEKCVERNKEKCCSHCGKWLCGTCHQLCELRGKFYAEINKVLAAGSDTLNQVQDQKVKVSKHFAAVSKQIEQNATAVAQAILQRHKEFKQEIKQELDRQLVLLDQRVTEITAEMNSVKLFTNDTSTKIVWSESLIEKKTESLKSALKATAVKLAVPMSTVEYIPNKNMIGNVSSALGILNVKHDKHITADYTAERITHQIFGSAGSGQGQFQYPSHAAISPVTGNAIVSDQGNNRIQVFSTQGQLVTAFGSKGKSPGNFNFGVYLTSGGVAMTRQGHVVVADTNNHRVQVLTEQGKSLKVIGSKGSNKGQFKFPYGIATDAGRIYVCDVGNRRVQVLDEDGEFIRELSLSTKASSKDWLPRGICVCPSGDVVVADANGKLEVFTREGDHLDTLGTGEEGEALLKHPCGVTADQEGNIIVTDGRTDEVHVMTQQGRHIRTFGASGEGPGELKNPVGVVCTRDGGVVVMDAGNHRLQYFRFG